MKYTGAGTATAKIGNVELKFKFASFKEAFAWAYSLGFLEVILDWEPEETGMCLEA